MLISAVECKTVLLKVVLSKVCTIIEYKFYVKASSSQPMIYIQDSLYFKMQDSDCTNITVLASTKFIQ